MVRVEEGIGWLANNREIGYLGHSQAQPSGLTNEANSEVNMFIAQYKKKLCCVYIVSLKLCVIMGMSDS